MAPRCLGVEPIHQPENRENSVDWLQELIKEYEGQVITAFEDLVRENDALRGQLSATTLAAAAAGVPLPGGRPLDLERYDSDVTAISLRSPVVPEEPGFEEDAACEKDRRPSDALDVPDTSLTTANTPCETSCCKKGGGGGAGEASRSSVSSACAVISWAMSGATSRPVHRTPLEKFVRSLLFETVMATVIIANCVTVGIWAHHEATHAFSALTMGVIHSLEHIFVALFLLELGLKFKVLGVSSFMPSGASGRANFVDMMLVLVTGLLFTWVLPLCGLIFGFDTSAGPYKTLSVLRTIRLVRIVRVFQRVPLFREAWMLIRGLSDSSRTLVWTCVVIFLVTYVFAIVGLATIVIQLQAEREVRTDPGELAMLDELLELMGGLDRLMATLVQVLTMDSFHAFTRPVLHFVWWSWIYFYIYISVAVVVLMNLVTAIIVENAFETSRADQDHVAREKEAKRKKDMGHLRKLFRAMDTDGGGTLSWDEFSASFEDAEMSRYWKTLDFQQEDCLELFQLLDDGDGEITTHEFLDALFHMTGPAQSKDIFKLQKTTTKLAMTVDSIACRVRMLSGAARPSKDLSLQHSPPASAIHSPARDAPTPRASGTWSNTDLASVLWRPFSRQVSPV